ncbi:MAG: ribonuclease HII [Saprospiraceae bacterium]|nr:ribonuclease HII [Saprospiraceae bacterium]MDW8230631.1 ribonuclease HII [Saprospiraceae bacterium]
MPLRPRVALQLCYRTDGLEAGCDEVGRGCIAGPVFAAAVILPLGFSHPMLTDSKQLSEGQREVLRAVIEQEALAWAVGRAEVEEIDRLNILQASFLAMHRALDQLSLRPEHVLVDGNRFQPYGNLPHQCVVKGDSLYANIAAASVLAKTHRDAEMRRLARLFPAYGWAENKGYPTAAHREAIRQYGPTQHHRQSFCLLAEERQMKLF